MFDALFWLHWHKTRCVDPFHLTRIHTDLGEVPRVRERRCTVVESGEKPGLWDRAKRAVTAIVWLTGQAAQVAEALRKVIH